VDQNRGDSVVVQTMAFNKPPDETVTNGSWFDRNKPFVAGSVKYGALILVALLLLFFVIRPAKRSLKAALAPPTEPLLLSAAATDTEDQRVSNGSQALEQTAERALNGEQPMMTVAELQ